MNNIFENDLQTSDYTLLYAEDEQGVRDVYSSFFNNYFQEVIAVENGDDAWEQYKEKKPDIVVLDIKMPGLNGIEVARKIRDINKNTIIIIMTANDTKEWLYSSVELGLTKFIKKGTIKFTDFEKLMLEITETLDSEKEGSEGGGNLWHISPKGSKVEIAWDLINHKLYKDKKVVILSKKLTQLINYFAQNRDRIITNEELAKELWEDGSTENKKTPSKQKIRGFIYNFKVKYGIDMFKSQYNQGYTIEYSEE